MPSTTCQTRVWRRLSSTASRSPVTKSRLTSSQRSVRSLSLPARSIRSNEHETSAMGEGEQTQSRAGLALCDPEVADDPEGFHAEEILDV